MYTNTFTGWPKSQTFYLERLCSRCLREEYLSWKKTHQVGKIEVQDFFTYHQLLT
jgi:hypothetical protein